MAGNERRSSNTWTAPALVGRLSESWALTAGRFQVRLSMAPQ
jgi:hypothetical protein